MGPTASGKSRLAEQLVDDMPAELINVDSALIYQGMDIGTAKPSPRVRKQVRYHLIDICDPLQRYSAAQFATDASRIMRDITARQRVPMLVGGTMLYFKALLEGLSDLPSSDEAVRKKLEEELQQIGLQALHRKLKDIDPISAARINSNDPQRTLRALEVYYISGKTLTELQGQRQKFVDDYKILNIALAPTNREVLHQRIEQRFHAMLQQGLVAEVEALYKRGDLSDELPSIRAVGYRQVWHYLQGKLSYDDMVEKAIIATRQLAKRQMTWLRSWADLIWLDSDDAQLCDGVIEIVRKHF